MKRAKKARKVRFRARLVLGDLDMPLEKAYAIHARQLRAEAVLRLTRGDDPEDLNERASLFEQEAARIIQLRARDALLAEQQHAAEKRGRDAHKKSRKWSDELVVKTICENPNMSVRELADLTGCPKSTIDRRRKEILGI